MSAGLWRSLIIAVVCLAVPAWASVSPGQKCAASKTKETGKKINCKAKCDSKAVKTGVTPDAACLSKCSTKFSLKWAKAESKGGCITVGDEAAIEAKVDAHLADLEASLQLGGPSKCTAAKYKESGKKGLCRLKCHAKAQKRGVAVDSLCLQKCTDKFNLKCPAAESYADCLAVAACATLEGKIDAFVDDVVAELPTETATTTSTTASPTTSAPTTTVTSTTLLALFQACVNDPSRTIYAGNSGTSACHQFDDNQALCEQAFHQTTIAGIFASCYFDAGSCNGCGPNNRDQGRCINTCVEGPNPVCAGDPTRTVFAGFSGTQACHQFDGNQASCEQAFHMDNAGIETSCYWDAGASECKGCGPSNMGNGDCVNTCPVCEGDPSRTTFAGGPFNSPCHQYDGDQTTCEQAFHVGGAHSIGIASCYYDSSSDECRGCGAHGDPELCSNECAVCPEDPTRVHVPGHSACHFYDSSPTSCGGAFITPLNGAPSASCWYDGDNSSCEGCGPTHQQEGVCTNTCEGPICGDNAVNQAGEECDGTDDAACAGIGLGCRGDCNCERCDNGTVDAGEACDTPGLQGTCPSGTTCGENCTACVTICGDGIVGGGETCDPALPSSCPIGESCLGCTSCQAVCGDGIVGGSEVCDPALPSSCPSGESCVGCTSCQAVCGDGIVGGSEVCDPPGVQGTCNVGEVCDATCSACQGCPGPTAVFGSAGGVFLGSTVGGTSISGSFCGGSSAPERYFEWTPNVSHVATITTCGGTTNYDTMLYIRQGAACGGSELACNDDNCGLSSTINPFVTAGTTYTIVVDGFSTYQGNFTLTVSPSGAFLD